MNYLTLLKNAPPHDSPEFLQYLRDNNVVVFENFHWLVIENFKYNTTERPWLTCFKKQLKGKSFPFGIINKKWADWTWLKKSAEEQSVKRFHIHIHK